MARYKEWVDALIIGSAIAGIGQVTGAWDLSGTLERIPIVGSGPQLGSEDSIRLTVASEGVLQWEKDIAEIARPFEIDPRFIAGIVAIESGGKTVAVSQQGAQGLAQIMPRTETDLRNKIKQDSRLMRMAQELNVNVDSRMTDPRTNLFFSAAYLEPYAPKGTLEEWKDQGRMNDYIRQAQRTVSIYHDGPNRRSTPSSNAMRYQRLIAAWLDRQLR